MTASISPMEVWERYLQHYSFTQLGWIFNAFNTQAVEEHIMGQQELEEVLGQWIHHQWDRVFARMDPLPELVNRALVERQAALPMHFLTFIEVLKYYEFLHIEQEKSAGFAYDTLIVLEEIYNAHNTSGGEGLKGKALFAVLEDLDIRFHSKEERQWYVDTVARLDKDGNGFINFTELCQIMRVVMDQEVMKTRQREFYLIKASKLPFDEVEDWNILFQQKDAEREGQGELELVQVKELLTSIGVKWDSDISSQLKVWLQEADENNNGTIDFGEFCSLIGKMWETNIHDIRGASRKQLKKDMVVSLKSVHGTFITSTKHGEISARNRSGFEESFTLIRLANGGVILRNAFGMYMNCDKSDVNRVLCAAESEKDAQQFKMTTFEDERVHFVVSSSQGGNLFVDHGGAVAISDGNPADEPFFPFTVVKQEELEKRCWSRLLIPKRKPSKLVEVGRSRSKMRAEDPGSPGKEQAAAAIDNALDQNKMRKQLS